MRKTVFPGQIRPKGTRKIAEQGGEATAFSAKTRKLLVIVWITHLSFPHALSEVFNEPTVGVY